MRSKLTDSPRVTDLDIATTAAAVGLLVAQATVKVYVL